ncbi:type IV toxin-antitoxin system AbiEi family antitoxin domain-containing protein [Granulicoccus sp. GXG6511]|uniref:type IV toxin-antitoxin system AbiEi family antitoxin domain-containing protein n=1 Tax=Granulicoccus sp. GXG6511 TaxID=3381351 RepID=UPI003D7C870C
MDNRRSGGRAPAYFRSNGGVVRYGELLERGLTAADVRRLVRSGDLIPIRRGCYAWRRDDLTPEARHLLLLEATRPTLGVGTVFTHGSAAVLHDLPVRITDLTRVHITRPDTSGRITKNVWRHSAPLPDSAVTEASGVPVTTIERTVVDLARWLPFADAVAVVDAALHRGVERAALEAEIELARRRRFNERARRAVAFGDARAESPGESRSRVLMAVVGLPMPQLQREFRDHNGEVDARVDFDWEEYGVSGEFDGEVKYGRLLAPGETVDKVVVFEKQREELLKTHGRWTVRWVNANLSNTSRRSQETLTFCVKFP